jgi:plastocyanin
MMLKRIGLIATSLLLHSAASVNASTHTITMTQFAFPAHTAARVGDKVQWVNHTITLHSTTSNTPLSLWGKDIPQGGSTTVSFVGAGSFPYHCRIHSFMTGEIDVSMTASATSGTTSTHFTLHWGSATAPSGFKYIVQKRVPIGTFVSLKSTTAPSGTFTLGTKGTWGFRAKLKRISNGAASGYSPILSITVS